jgi:hypothetical protein
MQRARACVHTDLRQDTGGLHLMQAAATRIYFMYVYTTRASGHTAFALIAGL